MKPSAPVRDELEAALTSDATRLGDVFRRKREGWTNARIAESVGASSHGFITNYNGYIAAILGERIPEGATLRQNTKTAVDAFALRNRDGLSPDAHGWLDGLSRELARVGVHRTDRDERRWVNETAADPSGSWHTLKISQPVYEELRRRQQPTEPSLDDVLRRLLHLG